MLGELQMQLLALVLLLIIRPSTAQVKVGAYYYPWHSDGFHNGEGYVRKILNQTPTLGEYDDTQPAVIKQHMKWSQRANIDVWITSWFGPGSDTDSTMLSTILPTIEGSSLEFALFYETANRVGTDNPTAKRVVDDVHYICENYVSHRNYYRIDGRPVLFIYITRVLDKRDLLDEVILLIRSTGSKRGVHFYIVGDHAFGEPPTEKVYYFDYFDAITNYDVYGMLGRFYVGEEKLAQFYAQQAQWKVQAALQDCFFIPSVTPGFNDRGVRLSEDHEPLSRKLSATEDFGSLFRASLDHAMTQVDPKADNLIVVTSFNEWHEDTQIEPAAGKLTNQPYNYTLGLEYDGYGTLYLDVLHMMTKVGSSNPIPPASPEDRSTAFHDLMHETLPNLASSEARSVNAADSVRDSCDDSRSGTFPTLSEGEQSCLWLAARPYEQFRYCNPNQAAYHLCEETCGKCQDSCYDTNGSFDYLGSSRLCSWLSLRPDVQRVVCVRGNPAYETVCHETCNSCDERLRHV